MSFSQRLEIQTGLYYFERTKSGIRISAKLKELHPERPPRVHDIQILSGQSYYQTNHKNSLPQTESDNLLKMEPSNSIALLKDINEKHQKMLFWPLALTIGLFFSVFFLYYEKIHLVLMSGVSTLLVTLFCVWLDQIRKNVILFYELDPTSENVYKKLYHSSVASKECEQIWSVQSKQTLHQHKERKYKAGAHQLYSRSSAKIVLSPPPYLQTNIETFGIRLGTQTLYFLPDLVLVYATNGVGAIPYEQLQSEALASQFVEKNIPPRDANQIGKTWDVVNLDGGPDRRLKENNELPVFLYSELSLKSSSGLDICLQYSKEDSAFCFDRDLKSFSKTKTSRPFTHKWISHLLPTPGFLIGNTKFSAFGLGVFIFFVLSLMVFVIQEPEPSDRLAFDPSTNVSSKTDLKKVKPFVPLRLASEKEPPKENVFFRDLRKEQIEQSKNVWKKQAFETLQKIPKAEQHFLVSQLLLFIQKEHPTVKEEQIRSCIVELDEEMLFFTLEFQVVYGPNPQKKTYYQLKWAFDQKEHRLSHLSPAPEAEFLKLTPTIQNEIDSFFAQTYYLKFCNVLKGQDSFHQEIVLAPEPVATDEQEIIPTKQIHPHYYGRFWQKESRLRSEQGSLQTEQAVLDGLNWLKKHQHPAGYWDAAQFQTQCQGLNCIGGGKPWTDVGQTGLALLAFMGAGNTPNYGPYRVQVQKGLTYLLKVQQTNGVFGSQEKGTHFIYNHAIATLALVEAYELSGKLEKYKIAAQHGVNFLIQAQNPRLAWRYEARSGDNDTSITGWVAKALASAKHSGINVPPESFEGILYWLDSVTDKETYRTGYIKRGDPGARLAGFEEKFESVETMTAAAVFARIFMGNHLQYEKEIQGVVALLSQDLPKWTIAGSGKSKIDYYYWYYGSLVLFQIGGGPWKVWNTHLKEALLPIQKKTGCEKGSWDPIGAWGSEGGRIYSTALNVMTLESYYRYTRFLKQKANFKIETETTLTPLAQAFRDINSKSSNRRLQAIPFLKQSASSDAVRALVQALRDSNHQVQIESTKALGEMAVESEIVVPALLASLKKTYVNLELKPPRRKVVVGVKLNNNTNNQNNYSASEAKQQLITLKQQQVLLRQYVLHAISSFGPRAMETAPLIMNILEKEEQEQIHLLALQALDKIIIEDLLPFSDPPVEADRFTKKTISALLDWLDKNNETFQYYGILFLGRIGQKADKSISRLLKTMDSPHEKIRTITFYALRRMGPSAKEAIPRLIEKLQDPEIQVRLSALAVLCTIGTEAQKAIPTLLKSLEEDENELILTQILETLFALGTPGSQMVPILMNKLSNPNENVRLNVAWLLGQFLEEAKIAIPHLKQALQDPSTKVRLYAKEALTKIEPNPDRSPETFLSKKDFSTPPESELSSSDANGIPFLSLQEESFLIEWLSQGFPEKTASALKQFRLFSAKQQLKMLSILLDIIQEKDLRWEVRTEDNLRISSGKTNAILALRVLPTDPEFFLLIQNSPLVLLLLKMIEDSDPRVRQATALTLSAFGSFSEEIASALMRRLLQERDVFVCQAIFSALGHLGKRAETTIPLLIEYLQSPEPVLRASAISCLTQLHASSSNVLSSLVELLRVANSQEQKEGALHVLGNLGSEIQEVVPLLLHLLETESDLTGAIRWALYEIDPKALLQKDTSESLSLSKKRSSNEQELKTRYEIKSLLGTSLFFLIGCVVFISLTLFYNSSQKFTFYGRQGLIAPMRIETSENQISETQEQYENNLSGIYEGLNHPDPQIRVESVRFLGEKNIQQSVPLLQQKRNDSSKLVSQEAAIALGKLNALDDETIFILIEALRDINLNAKTSQILKNNGTLILPTLIRMLKETQHEGREYAAWMLGEIGIQTEDVAFSLTRALKDNDKKVMHYAARALKKIPLGEKVVPSLIELLQHSDEAIRRESAEALGDVGPQAKSAIPILIKTLQDSRSQVRICAMWALGNIGKEAQIAGASLLLALHEGNLKERQWAAGALAMIGLHFEEASPFLQQFIQRRIGKLKDSAWFIRKMAIQALGNLGDCAKSAVPYLQIALKDENEFVRSGALKALLQIQKAKPEKIIESLSVSESELHSFESEESKMETLPTLLATKEFIAESTEAQPFETQFYNVLDIDSLEKAKTEEQKESALLENASLETIPALFQILNNPNSEFRSQVQELLEHLSSSPEAIPALTVALKHSDKQVREFSASALKGFGSEAKEAVSNLIVLLVDPSYSVRKEAIQALGAIGVESIDAKPLLLEMIEKDPLLESFAKEALAQIAPEPLSVEQSIKIENLQNSILTVVQARFQEVPEVFKENILKITKLETLQQVLTKVATAESLDTVKFNLSI